MAPKGWEACLFFIFLAIDALPMKTILSISGAGGADVDEQQRSLFSRDTFCSRDISQFDFTACFRRFSAVPIEQQSLPSGS